MGRREAVLTKAENKSKNVSLISKIILTLYLAVDLIYDLKAAEYDGVRWFYVSVINLIGLGYIFKESEYFQPFEMVKKVRVYFYLCLAFFLVSCFSLINAYNVTEGFVQISRLVNILVGVFVVFNLFKNNPKEIFDYAAKAIVVLALYHSLYTVKYFLENYYEPRTKKLLREFLHYFGNVNIFTAALAMKLPFGLYLYISKEKFWKYLGVLTFFLGWISVFFVGSRTANISLILVFLALIGKFTYDFIKTSEKSSIYEIGKIVLLFFIFSFIGLSTNRVSKYKINSLDNVLYTVTPEALKNKTILDKNKRLIEKIKPNFKTPKKTSGFDSGRISLWNSAIKLFNRNPLTGIGYGNYKLVLKEDHLKRLKGPTGNFISTRRVHNDFLEKLAETGVFGFLIYISLFVYLLYCLFLMLKRELSPFLLILLVSLGMYTFDSLINFPIERPTVVIYFLIVSGVVIAYYQFTNKEEDVTKKGSNKPVLLLIVLFLTTSFSAYSNYLVYQSQVMQRTITFDLKGKNVFGNDEFKYDYQDIKDMWMDYPNLNSSGANKYYQKALYAIVDKDYEEAIKVLNDNSNHTEHQIMVNDLKAKIYYFGLKQKDSGKYYAEKVFKLYPSFYNNYFTLKTAYTQEKDTVNKLRVMNRYTNYNYVAVNEWKKKANYIFDITNDMDLATKTIDTAMAFNPNDFSLIEAKQLLLSRQTLKASVNDKQLKAKHKLAVDLFKQRKFNGAIKVYQDILKQYPKDYFAMQNIGIIYLAKKKYYEAIQYLTPVIKAKVFKKGKAEYSRGLAYEKTNQFKKARRDYRASRRKKYHQAMQLKESQYTEPKDLPLNK